MALLSIWLILLIISIIVWFTLVSKRKIGKDQQKKAIILGIALLLFDFIFETIGAMTGLWTTSGSILSLGAVPIEVSIISFFVGYVYSITIPKNLKPSMGILFTFLIAVVGASIELILVNHGLVSYTGGWTSFHALASYFLVFYGMNVVNSKL